MNRFEGKVILITGAGSGIGRATALQLVKEGAKLSLVDLQLEGLEETKRQILEVSPEAEIILVTANVANEKEVKGYVDKTVETFGKIDGFHNNAGIDGKPSLTEDYDIDAFHNIINVNLNGAFYGLKYVLKIMKEQGFGSVVNTSSVHGILAKERNTAYVTSKHGIVGLTRNTAIEYGKYDVNVNAIAPGAILTPMVEDFFKERAGEDWKEAEKEYAQPNPMKRLGKPEEVGYLVVFLLSDQANYINGVVVPIDGGQSYEY